MGLYRLGEWHYHSRKANENTRRTCETGIFKNNKFQKKSVHAQGIAKIPYRTVYCTIKIPKVAEGNPQSCMRNFPIIADAFGISLRTQ